MNRAVLPPHVLIFPFPAQGHVNSMLKLAELLSVAGLHVTFIVSANTQTRLLRYTNVQSRFGSYPGFRFQTFPGELRQLNPHSSDLIMDLIDSLKATTKPFLRELLVSDRLSRPVTCIIVDGIVTFAIDVAEDLGIPILIFRTISSCAFWTYFCIPQLIQAHELPFNGNDLDVGVMNVMGMEGFLRRRDLPSFCRAGHLADPALQWIAAETQQTPRAQGLILNTFEDLEGPVLSLVRTQCSKVYTIGPLHAHLKTRLASTSSNSLWEEDKRCITWLDNQPLKSVIYVSFGSITTIKKEELMEFWHGLVNSGQRFLWVRRPDSVAGEDVKGEIPAELEEGTKARGYLVGWAPQEEVLAHPAVGGFLTHSGWNSTLESIVEGVPMLCWPDSADQQVNSRFVGEVWKLGLDMKDTCDRVIVENMVKDLMVVRRDEFIEAADQMAKLARKSLSEGGSSYCNLDRLIEDIRLLGVPSQRT